jgi:hypothetical protein
LEGHQIRLSSTEIAGLWSTYIQDSANICVSKYFLKHMQDQEIKPIIEQTIQIATNHLNIIIQIFNEESIPIPHGFNEKDVNLDADALYTDLYALSYVYGMNRTALFTYGLMTSNVVRKDILDFFGSNLIESKKLYEDSVGLMLSKGIYDRPPKISYPEHVEFIKEKEKFLAGWVGERRPINAIELTEIFFNIERSYFVLLLLQGFLQSANDEELIRYYTRGKEIAEKQIKVYNKVLVEEDLLGTVPISMEVTNSTMSPFSDKLMMFLISTVNSTGVSYLGHALSTSMRRDLGSHYFRFLMEIMHYSEDGMNIMIERGWMEKPPATIDRSKFRNQSK